MNQRPLENHSNTCPNMLSGKTCFIESILYWNDFSEDTLFKKILAQPKTFQIMEGRRAKDGDYSMSLSVSLSPFPLKSKQSIMESRMWWHNGNTHTHTSAIRNGVRVWVQGLLCAKAIFLYECQHLFIQESNNICLTEML